MEISLKHIKVRDLYNGYFDNEIEGCYGYHGKLNIRPPYQRGFIYDDDKKVAVINSILSGYPLNVMYWVINPDGTYELLDGQQRTCSICDFCQNNFGGMIGGREVVDFNSLEKDEQEKILDYELNIYVCDGTDKEKLNWFKTINIGSVQLTDQELRNALYHGPWLTKMKSYFSSRKWEEVGEGYLKGDYKRQEILETVLKWIVDYLNKGISDEDKKWNINKYMSKHRNDPDDKDLNDYELVKYFKEVMSWVKRIFKDYRKEMEGLSWGLYYNKYGEKTYVTENISGRVYELMKDPEVKSKKGIYIYELEGEDKDAIKYLNLRTFDYATKRTVYTKQNGVCPICHEQFELKDMEADHIIPWSKGGQTVEDNCQMLCKECNRKKSNS